MATNTVHTPSRRCAPRVDDQQPSTSGTVVDMREYKTREVVQELEELLAHAKAGRVAGIAYCVQTARGGEHVGLIGKYKGDAARVLLASAHLHNRAQQIISGEGD